MKSKEADLLESEKIEYDQYAVFAERCLDDLNYSEDSIWGEV